MNLLIDLGSAHFRAALAEGDRVICEPSIVAYDGSGRTIIGTEALNMVGRHPEFIDVTTPIERGVIRDVQAVVQIIQYCVKQFITRGFSRKYDLTIAIPSGITQVEQRALEESGKIAGARKVKTMDASVAAALGAGLPIQRPTGCLVVNLGAGVTESTILSMNGVVESKRLAIGGKDIDKAIVERVRKQYALLLGLRSAEQLKRQCNKSAQNVMELPVRGKSLRTGLPESILVPRTVVEEQFDLYCEMIVDLIVQTMSKCPPEIAGDITERGLVFVGGGALTAGLSEKMMTRIDVPIIVAEEPEMAVIMGLLRMESGRNRSRTGLASVFSNKRSSSSNLISSDLKKVAGEESPSSHSED